MIEKKSYADYSTLIDYDKEICRLYDNTGKLIDEIKGYYLENWLFKSGLFYKKIAHMTSFEEGLNYHSGLYHVDNGKLDTPGIRVINYCLWEDYMWVIMEDNNVGLMDFNLQWIVHPDYSYAECSDTAMDMPFMHFYKQKDEYIFIAKLLKMYPESGYGTAEIILFDQYILSKLEYVLVIREVDLDGKMRYVYIAKYSDTEFDVQSSEFEYNEIHADDYAVYCTKNGVKTQWVYPLK